MARNSDDMPSDYFVKKQGNLRQRQRQPGKSKPTGTRNFKLKRKGQNMNRNLNNRLKNIGNKHLGPKNGPSYLARRNQEQQKSTPNSVRGRKGKTNAVNNLYEVGKSGGYYKSQSAKSSDKQKPKKLFTKSFDARKKIDAKRQAEETRSSASTKNATKAQLNDSRQQHRDTEITKKRELSLIGGKMQIVSKIKDEEERKALFTGDSLRVTTLQSAEERHQHREAMIQGNNALLITAVNRDIEPVNSSNDSNELSEYSLFEARRKAETEKIVAIEHPKLSSLHPISRPKKPAPAFQSEENTLESLNNSSRILVTNLHPNVSTEDIYELFSVVGPLQSSKILRSGVAEVIYKISQDASIAYKKYNGRNLDGQPMICKVAIPEQQIYQPPPRVQQVENKTPLTKSSSRPVVFTVKI